MQKIGKSPVPPDFFNVKMQKKPARVSKNFYINGRGFVGPGSGRSERGTKAAKQCSGRPTPEKSVYQHD
jgi:hypothetical protein